MADAKKGRAVRVVGKRWLPPKVTETTFSEDGPYTSIDGLTHDDLDGFLSSHRGVEQDGTTIAPALDDVGREVLLKRLATMKPSTRLAHDTILDALTPYHRTRIVGRQKLCIIVRVPAPEWANVLPEAMKMVVSAVSVAEGLQIPDGQQVDMLRVEHERYRPLTPLLVGVDRLVDRLGYGHVAVAILDGELPVDMPMVRALSDVEIELDPGTDPEGVQDVIRAAHPGFTWPAHLSTFGLRPKVLDLATARAMSAAHVLHLLDKLVPASALEDKAEKQALKDAEKESSGNAKAQWEREKARRGGVVELLRPSKPKLEDLRGYGALAAWAQDLLLDLVAFHTGKLKWADVDAGCLVAGPPGTGKTLFASALAASSKLPLIAFSYADAQSHGDGHLGTVIKRIRAVFAEAMKAAPCILFIDELDAFSARNSGPQVGRNDDWWSAIIACLLELLDGTSRREGVIVIGATNYADKIDPALRRSGRLDRVFHVGLPDAEALVGIFGHHLPDVDPEAFEPAAVALAGMISGADVARYAREARRAARRQDRPLAVEDLLTIALPPDDRPEEKRRMIAVHEAGHAVAYMVLREMPRSMSIIGDGETGGAVWVYRSLGMGRLADVEGEAIALLAGRAAEEVILGIVSGGAGGREGSDLSTATQLVADTIGAYGLGGALSVHQVAPARIESEMTRLYGLAIELVTERREAIEALADLVLERRVLPQRALEAFAEEHDLRGAR